MAGSRLRAALGGTSGGFPLALRGAPPTSRGGSTRDIISHISITPSGATWVIRAGGTILAETSRAKELREGPRGPVIYIPREDVAMALFERSPTQTTCPYKGQASYFSYVGPDGTIKDAAWSYKVPKDDVAGIAGHLAFYLNKVTVERF